MEFKKHKVVFKEFTLIIEEDLPDVGFYLLVFKDNKCIFDDLQNDIRTCKRVAFEEFGVPIDLWNEVSE